MYLDINGFIVAAESLPDIEQGKIGLSKFQREAFEISKTDVIPLKVAKIEDKNPLNSIDLILDVLYADETCERDASGALKVHEKEIFERLRVLYSGSRLFLNLNEVVPLSLYDESLILQIKVSKIENITHEYRHLIYGVLTDQTEMNCKPSKASASKLKVQTDRV